MPLASFTASQFVFHNMLLNQEELEVLLPEGFYVILGQIKEAVVLTKDEFIALSQTQERFKVGFAFDLSHFKMTKTPKGQIAQVQKPVMEIKPFSFTITSEDQILEDVPVKDSIPWGLSFSYPRLFSVGDEVKKSKGVFQEADFFDEMRKFKRKETDQVFLEKDGKRLSGTFRMGKKSKDLASQKLLEEGLKLYD